MAKKKYIDVMDTTFGDSLYSLYNCEIATKDILPAVEAATEAGITHFEFMHAKMFKNIVNSQKQNPFEYMKQFRLAVGEEANLQLSAHSTNTFLDSCNSSELIELYTSLVANSETTTVRHFDPLNDIRNFDFLSYQVSSNNILNEVTITMMESPTCCVGLYSVDFYRKKVTELLDSGIAFDSICFLDVNGSTAPSKIYEVIKMSRELLGDNVHIRFNTRDSASIGVTSYISALEAGVDGIDLSCAPASGFTAMPDILPLLYATKDLNFNLDGLEIKKIQKFQKFLKNQLDDYWSLIKKVDTHLILLASSVLGDSLLQKVYDLKSSGDIDLLDSIIEEMVDIIDRGGCASTIDDVSTYYWNQAILNIKYGKFKKIDLSYAKMALGFLGRTPIASDPNLLDKISNVSGLEFTYEDPIEISNSDIKKSLDYYKNNLRKEALHISDENIYILAACGTEGFDYLRNDTIKKMKEQLESKRLPLNIPNTLVKSENKAIIIQEGQEIISKYNGSILDIKKNIDDNVKVGDIIVVIKSPDLEISIMSPFAGKLVSIVSLDNEILKGDVIAVVG